MLGVKYYIMKKKFTIRWLPHLKLADENCRGNHNIFFAINFFISFFEIYGDFNLFNNNIAEIAKIKLIVYIIK